VTQVLRHSKKPAKIAGMAPRGKKVVPIPITREKGTEIVREIAKDSRRWPILLEYSERQEWFQIVNRRQIELCLKEGYILEDKSTVNDHGHHEFSIVRVCAGLNVKIKVAIDTDSVEPKAYVIGIDGDRIEV